MDIIKLSNKCLECKKPGCMAKCPSHINVPLIMHEVKQGNLEEAANILYEYQIAPFICSVLCDHEKGCRGGCVYGYEKAVEIPTVFKGLSERVLNKPIEIKQKCNKNVAIIGGGVAGLSAAEHLVSNGCKVTIFEATNALGGVITKTLPEFRYDKSILTKWINKILDAGAEVKYNYSFGKNLFFSDLDLFDDIVIAIGAECSKMIFKGEGIYDALDLLNLHLTNSFPINNQNVIVVGGGNTAMDIARVLLRHNNNVQMVYRRNFLNAPSSKKEIELTFSEGVIPVEYRSPKEPIYKDGKLIGLNTHVTKLVDNGEARLSFVETDKEELINCDSIVLAIGASPDLSYLNKVKPDIFNGRWVEKMNNGKLHIIGDAFSGPSTFSNAIHSGLVVSKEIVGD